MRAVFQTQPEVGHVYLGSKRHVLDSIFNDRNEPFWRSAKRWRSARSRPAEFRPFVAARFDDTDKGIIDRALDRLLEATGGHPYGTQELAYFVWELVPTGHSALEPRRGGAREGPSLRAQPLHALWDDATRARAPAPARALARSRAGLLRRVPARATTCARADVQRALGALVHEEVVGRNEQGDYPIVEPFLAEWVQPRPVRVAGPPGAEGAAGYG